MAYLPIHQFPSKALCTRHICIRLPVSIIPHLPPGVLVAAFGLDGSIVGAHPPKRTIQVDYSTLKPVHGQLSDLASRYYYSYYRSLETARMRTASDGEERVGFDAPCPADVESKDNL